jgi:hypothetical protein
MFAANGVNQVKRRITRSDCEPCARVGRHHHDRTDENCPNHGQKVDGLAMPPVRVGDKSGQQKKPLLAAHFLLMSFKKLNLSQKKLGLSTKDNRTPKALIDGRILYLLDQTLCLSWV